MVRKWVYRRDYIHDIDKADENRFHVEIRFMKLTRLMRTASIVHVNQKKPLKMTGGDNKKNCVGSLT